MRTFLRFLRGCVLGCLASGCWMTVHAEPQALKPGLATAHEGNSLTDHMTGITDYARSMGFGHQLINFTRPGCPPATLWADYLAGKKTFLSDQSWDILSVQPFGYGSDPKFEKDFLPISGLYKEALKKNPVCRLHILAQWPSNRGENSEWDSVINSQPGERESWDTWRYPGGCLPYYKHLRKTMEDRFPRQPTPLITPVTYALMELKKKIDAGQVPGFKAIWDVYEDAVHFGARGRYVQVATVFATYYRVKPHGGTQVIGFWRGPSGVDREFARIAWDCAWKACTDNWEISGVHEGGAKIMSQPTLPPATVSRPYFKALSCAGIGRTYTWKASDPLPSGLMLDTSSGTLSGTPTKPGEYKFRMEVDDADPSTPPDQRTFTLVAAVPQAPQIITGASLPDGYVGAEYRADLVGADGFGNVTWSVAGGTLPGGLTLDKTTGTLAGKPTQAGAYDLPIQLQDEKQQAATRTFHLNLMATRPNGLICEIYNQIFEKAEDYKTASREGIQTVPNIGLTAKQRDQDFGLRFVGYLYCKEPGEYGFTLSADDHGLLYLDDKLIVESKMQLVSGKEKGMERHATVKLDAGYHAMSLVYWQRKNNMELKLLWRPPGVASDMNLPGDVLFTEKPSLKN